MLSWFGKLLRGAPTGLSPGPERDSLVREALARQQAGQFEEAERYFYRALALAPDSAEIRLHLANLFRVLGRRDAALDCCQEAVRLAPEFPQGRNNLGNAYRDLGQLEQAIAEFRAAIALDSGLAEAHFNLGLAVLQRGHAAEAMQSFRRALQARPGFADAHLNLGFLLEEGGDVRGAIASYRSALALAPELVEAHVNLGMQLLLAGQFAEGWKEYEWRLRYPEYSGADLAAVATRWDGGALDGRTILLDAEQGFGDAIQFLRYAALAAERGGRVVVRCAPELTDLFSRAPGVTAVVPRGRPLPAFATYCPLPSLPLVFGTTLDSIPARVPYVSADAGEVARWKTRLADGEAGCKVGLVWASQSKHRTAPAKSISLDALAPLAAVGSLRFYSLQMGDAARQAERAPAGMRIEDLSSGLRDFSDTAAVVANLDLVISVDTAVAHLAGAMGRPAWTLLKYAPDWRWLLARGDCPWYPTMQLFRQASLGDWNTVIDEVARELRQFAATAGH
jgi:tetratricopeptide (TPR) repeat protein